MSTTITETTAHTSDLTLAAYWQQHGLVLTEAVREDGRRAVSFTFADPDHRAAALVRQLRADDYLRAFTRARNQLAAAIAITRAAGRCAGEQLTAELARRGWAR